MGEEGRGVGGDVWMRGREVLKWSRGGGWLFEFEIMLILPLWLRGWQHNSLCLAIVK